MIQEFYSYALYFKNDAHCSLVVNGLLLALTLQILSKI